MERIVERQQEGEAWAAVAPRDGWWRVTAAPFVRAARLRAFLAAVGGIEGISELVAERFRSGELALTVRYGGTASLAEHLADLPDFRPAVEAGAGGALRLTLEDEPEDD